MSKLYGLFLSLFLAAPASGQSVVPPDVVSPGVVSVVSGGYWEADGQAGSYRIIIVNSGYEHVVSHAFVQWVAEPSSPDGQTSVIASVEPALPFGQGIASLTASLTPIGTGQVQVKLAGVVSIQPEQEVSATLTATGPGVVIINGD